MDYAPFPTCGESVSAAFCFGSGRTPALDYRYNPPPGPIGSDEVATNLGVAVGEQDVERCTAGALLG